MVSKEEFLGWLEHPVTKALRQALRAKIEFEKERWASGAFTDQGHFATAILNAKAIGNCEGLAFTAGLDYETLASELSE